MSVAVGSGLVVGLVACFVLSVSLGPVSVDPLTVWQVIGHHTVSWPSEVTWTGSEDSIVWAVRVPRAIAAVLVGGTLAMSGVALQALVRNLLAEPYLIGVSSGASTGAAVALLAGAASASYATLSLAAFVGGVAASAAVLTLSAVGGRITPVRLVLAGVMVGYVGNALTSFLVFASDDQQGGRGLLFWLLGSLTHARWSEVPLLAASTVGCGVALLLWRRSLDALAIGDETALTLGVPPVLTRALVFVVVALAVGVAVSVTGPIGFVGLVIPHVTRRLVGGEHARLLPAAAVLGGCFLIGADLLARVAFDPRELPLGIVTALVGAPMVLGLVRRTRE